MTGAWRSDTVWWDQLQGSHVSAKNDTDNDSARWGGWSAPRPGRFTPGKDPVPIVWEAGWAPGPVWTGAENLAPTGILSPDRPARSESLYLLSYPGTVS